MGTDMGQTRKNVCRGACEHLLLSYDVVSKFGYQFATKLSIAMSENLAQVYADTTLNGLSGQEIKFQNTETTRTPTLESKRIDRRDNQYRRGKRNYLRSHHFPERLGFRR
jgi:hypothetical protein